MKFFIIDDNPQDIFLIEKVMEALPGHHELMSFNDPERALSYFKILGGASFGMPAGVILDVNMPKLSGFELLEYLRTQEPYKELPFIVLSSSDNKEDKLKASALGADYYTKPDNIDTLELLIKEVVSRMQERIVN